MSFSNWTLDFTTLSQRRSSTVTDRAFARLTIAVRMQQQIFDLKKYSDFNGSEKSGPFLHITSEKLTHNLIDYYLFVGYNIDG